MKRPGQILVQTIVLVAVLLSILVSLASLSLHSASARGRYVNMEEASAELDGGLARAWSCLNETVYPSGGVCVPSEEQKTCVPAGISYSFYGTFPDCRLALSVEKGADTE